MRLSRNAVILITLVYVCTGLFFFSYRYLEEGSHSRWPDWRPAFIDEMSAAVAAYLLFWPLYRFSNRFPLLRGHLWKHLGLHIPALLVWSFLHTSMLATLRPALYPLWIGRPYDYGFLPVRYLMELSIGAFIFAAQIGVITAFRFQHELRSREVRTAQLERELTQAQLDALRLQLRPHFLFNALNAISAVMYDDPRKADRMITSLSDFLRAVLRQDSTHTVTLADELRLLDQYLAIMHVRFGEQLRVTRSVPEALLSSQVPPLLLQPLVENCIQHGADPATGERSIHLQVSADGETLRLDIRDQGPGFRTRTGPTTAPPHSAGLGLSNTRRRLERLYGPRHQFLLGDASDEEASADGHTAPGAVTTIMLPLTHSRPEPDHA